MADAALKELSPKFEKMYSRLRRPSVPPERLLKASLLMALYTICGERMVLGQLSARCFQVAEKRASVVL